MYRLAKVLMLLGLGWASGSAQAYLIQVSQGSVVLGTVQPYTGSLNAVRNYNYPNNPVNGPTPQRGIGQIWFYQQAGSNDLAWNVTFNVLGSGRGAAGWNINVLNNPLNANVLVSDDPGELTETTPTSNVFNGNWTWSGAIDGGVIGALGGSSWMLTITANSYSGTTSLQVAGPGVPIIPLALTTGSTASIVFTPLLNGIPEPASALLLASGLAATLGWRRRRASRQPVTTAC